MIMFYTKNSFIISLSRSLTLFHLLFLLDIRFWAGSERNYIFIYITEIFHSKIKAYLKLVSSYSPAAYQLLFFKLINNMKIYTYILKYIKID